MSSEQHSLPPDEIRTLRQWVVWKEKQRGDKTSKVPVRPIDGELASTTNPADWTDYDTAYKAFTADGTLSGVGFVFAVGGGVVGVDIDGCVDAAGTIDGKAQGVIDRIGSYAESSPSGKGVHIIARTSKPLPDAGRRAGNVEVYQSGRYFTWTGRKLPQSPHAITDATDALAGLHAELFPPEPEAISRPSGPAPTGREVVEKITAWSDRAALWSGDASAYGSSSDADLALANHVAYFCGNRPDLIRDVLLESALVRDKWDRADYLPRTINKALAGRTAFYDWSCDGAGDGGNNDEAVLICMNDVQAEEINWLWEDRIAMGKLTLLCGDPGQGKSFITVDLAARVSRGAPWPVGDSRAREPGDVIMLSAEDGVADTIKRRLDDAAADSKRVFVLKAVRCKGKEHPFTLEKNLPALERVIRGRGSVRLVTIDPVTAFLGGADGHKNSDIRGLLAPLAGLAEKHNTAVVAVTHLNKGNGPPMYRAMGSLAFVAAARSVWVVAPDKGDSQRRYVLPIKSNLAADVGGMAYSIVDGRVQWEPHAVSTSADDLLAVDEPGDRTALQGAISFLREALSGGPVRKPDLEKQAKAEDISMTTLRRAKDSLKVEAYKDARGWLWKMPNMPKLAEDAHTLNHEHLGNLEHKPARPQVVVQDAQHSSLATLPTCSSRCSLDILDQPQQRQQLTGKIVKLPGDGSHLNN